MRRRRIYRATQGKDGIKVGSSLTTVHGNGSDVQEFGIISTSTGDRSLDGGTQTTRENANTGGRVQISDIVKYVNLEIKSVVTEDGETAFTNGFIEWAVVWRNEVSIPIPSTNIGTLTLATIATRMFRGDCLMTGSYPMAHTLPNIQNVVIKLPKKAIKQKIGNELTLYFMFRDGNTTDLQTTTIKTITSSMFKVYS